MHADKHEYYMHTGVICVQRCWLHQDARNKFVFGIIVCLNVSGKYDQNFAFKLSYLRHPISIYVGYKASMLKAPSWFSWPAVNGKIWNVVSCSYIGNLLSCIAAFIQLSIVYVWLLKFKRFSICLYQRNSVEIFCQRD